MEKNCSGTLAIDLGNTNTVAAFQNEKGNDSFLIDIPGITASPGVVPTAVWFEGKGKMARIGLSALKKRNFSKSEIYFYSNFKRLIGNPFESNDEKFLSHIESGEKFFLILWENMPKELDI